MKKDYKSIACPECHGENIDITVTYKNKHIEDISFQDKQASKLDQQRVMNCHCQTCNKDYEVSQGNDTYTVLKEPFAETPSRDIQLLAIYNSNFDYDFKIVKASTYNGLSITMAIVENDEYPVVIPEETDIKDLPKVKKILFNTWMDRYH